MKKKYYCAMALATLMMGACTDDTDLGQGGIPGGGSSAAQDGRTELKFVLGGFGGGVVSYGPAVTVAGENELRTLDIFVFGKDTFPDGTERPDGKMLLEEIFRSDGTSASGDKIEITNNGTESTAAISLMGKNRKRLYFVGNGRNQDAFNQFKLGETDTTAFASGLTNKLTGHIACPLLMTADYAINIADSLKKGDAGVDWNNSIDIVLKRRMARFDIVNTSVDSRFFIEWIQLENPRSQAYLFDDAAHGTEADATTNANGYWSKLTDLWTTSERIDFKAVDNANNGDALAAFYTYPAPKGTAPTLDEAKDFSIVLGGRSGAAGDGDPVLYPVLLRKDQQDAATAMTVDANHRYVINVLSVGTNYITATINVLDWNVADTIIQHAGYGTFGLSAPAETGTIDEGKNTLVLADNSIKANQKITVAASTEWTAEVIKGDDWLSLTAPAAGTVAKELVFETTKANPSSEKPRTGAIIFRNVMRPSITQTLLVEQPVNDSGTHLNVGEPKGIVGLSIEGDTIVLPGYDLRVAIPVESTDGTPTITNAGDGIFATTAMNATSDSLILTMAENKTGTVKRGTVKVAGTTLEQTLAIRQMPQSLGIIRLVCPTIAIDKQTLNIGADALAATEVTVNADSEWTFDGHTDNTGFTQDWVTISNITNPTGTGSFEIAATANDTYAARSISLKLVNTSKPEKIYYVLNVTQAAKQETLDVASVSGGSATYAGGTVSLAIDETSEVTVSVTPFLADGDWEVGTVTGNEAGWLTVGTKDAGADTFKITPSDNSGNVERTATITIQKMGDASVKKVITVTQAGV
ncbi:BACON domain-containing protein [Parabacteroides bouchesdurhonensis]|uniref:BACON domain-containing protein n=1 Tax=Parabacteroides bouchesdurhonensis TaxID=1936995 RepID=UPI000C84B217|nr:BACON domain-containing carbohydrate-binding protein [Parabacteroides bouchesdurhonensis]